MKKVLAATRSNHEQAVLKCCAYHFFGSGLKRVGAVHSFRLSHHMVQGVLGALPAAVQLVMPALHNRLRSNALGRRCGIVGLVLIRRPQEEVFWSFCSRRLARATDLLATRSEVRVVSRAAVASRRVCTMPVFRPRVEVKICYSNTSKQQLNPFRASSYLDYSIDIFIKVQRAKH